MIKRILATALCIVTLFSCCVTVGATETTAPTTAPTQTETITTDDVFASISKTFTLHLNEVQGYVQKEPTSLALWENPILSSGQRGIICDLTVKNGSNKAADLKMDPVPLPYDDADKMMYLNYVMLTITDKASGEVLFDDSYAHINDPVDAPAGQHKGFAPVYNDMQPGETHSYQIEMKCLYTYTGEVYTDLQMPWSFSAETETTLVKEGEGLPEWVEISLIGLAATIGVLIIITIIRAIDAAVKKRKKNKIDVDNG